MRAGSPDFVLTESEEVLPCSSLEHADIVKARTIDKIYFNMIGIGKGLRIWENSVKQSRKNISELLNSASFFGHLQEFFSKNSQ